MPYVIRLGHAEAMKRAVAANGWVCCAPHHVVAEDVAAGRLRAVSIRSPLQQAAITTLRDASTTRTNDPLRPTPPATF